MMLIIGKIANAMIRETRLPDRRTRFQTVRESSFDELHGPLKRNLRRGREQRVDVVGHDHELVEKKFPLITIMRESFDQEAGRCLQSKDWTALRGDGGDEEDAVGVHSAMVAWMGWRCL